MSPRESRPRGRPPRPPAQLSRVLVARLASGSSCVVATCWSTEDAEDAAEGMAAGDAAALLVVDTGIERRWRVRDEWQVFDPTRD